MRGIVLFLVEDNYGELHSFPTRRSSDLGARGARVEDVRRRADGELQVVAGRRDRGHRRRPATTCSSPSARDRKSTRLNSSHVSISYAVFCLKKKKKIHIFHKLPYTIIIH